MSAAREPTLEDLVEVKFTERLASAEATSYKYSDRISQQNLTLLKENDSEKYWCSTNEDLKPVVTVDFKGKDYTFHGVGFTSIHK